MGAEVMSVSIIEQIKHMESELALTEYMLENHEEDADLEKLHEQARMQEAIIASLLRLVRIGGGEFDGSKIVSQ